MASQHELQLKAVLDTSDIQQKLNDLRSSQGQASGNQASNGLGRLGQTFAKLESTLNQLNKSVEKLSSAVSRGGLGPAQNNFQSRAAVTQAVQQAAAHATAMAIPMMSSPAMTQSITHDIKQTMKKTPWLNSDVYSKYRSQFFNNLQSHGKLENAFIESDLRQLGKIGDNAWTHNMVMSGAANKVFGDAGIKAAYQQLISSFNTTQEQMLNALKNTQPNGNVTTKTSINALLQNRKFASIVGGQILGGAADMATDFGYNRTGIVLSGLGKGFTAGGSAAYTASLFGAGDKAAGRIGLAIGATTAIAQVVKGLYDFKDALQKAAEAQRQFADAQHKQGFGLAESRSGFLDNLLARNVLKTNNVDIARQRLEYSRSTADWQISRYREMEDPAAYSTRIRQRAEKMKTDYNARKSGWDSFQDAMSRMGTRLGVSEVADTPDAIDKAANKVIETYYKQFEARGKEAQAAQATVDLWQKVVDNLTEARHRSEDALSRMRQEEGHRKAAVVNQAYEQADIFRMNDQLRASQMFALGIMRDRKLAPQAQFDKLASELDQVREQRNKKLQEAYSLNRDILLGRGKNAGNYEDMQTQRNKALQEADNLASRASVLENALQSIRNLTIPPDFSHVQSLAQYGFNMGERDDTAVVMEKYYSKMTDLTKQIRDKIDQGITTTATYE